MKTIEKIVTISALSASLLLANSMPSGATIDKQLQAPKDIPSKSEGISTIDLPQDQELIKDGDDESKKIFIEDFEIEGNSKLDSSYLYEYIKDYANKELSLKELQEISSIITNLYRDKGYFLARAYILAQDIAKNNNILTITVLEGRYGEVNINNNSLVRDSVIKEIFDIAKDEDIINKNTIQRAMLLVNDRAGVNIQSATISPGAEVGSSDFNIETKPENRLSGYLVADNYGSRYTGVYRAQGLININSPFERGDKISISGLLSDSSDLKNGKIAYELPLMPNGLKANISYSRTDYKLIKEYKDLDAKGKSDIFELGVSYPIIRSPEQSLWTSIKYYHKDMKDYMLGSKYEDKDIDSFVAGVEYNKSYSINSLPSYLSGDLNLHRAKVKTITDSSHYTKVDAYISNDIFFNRTYWLNTSLNLQKALNNKNLDGTDELSLGGAYGVKLYPYSEQNGDNGYILSNEIFAQLPNINSLDHRVGLFYDIGDVYNNKNSDITFERKRLKDIGVGYYTNYKDFFGKFQLAYTANSQAIQSENSHNKHSKFLFQVGVVF